MIETLLEENPHVQENADSTSMKRFIREYFSNLPIELTDERLQRALVSVLRNAFYTTFTDDYDLNDAGIGLESLAPFPRQTVDVCLDSLQRHVPNSFVREYVDRFRKKYP